jgi:hypothetical protein
VIAIAGKGSSARAAGADFVSRCAQAASAVSTACRRHCSHAMRKGGGRSDPDESASLRWCAQQSRASSPDADRRARLRGATVASFEGAFVGCRGLGIDPRWTSHVAASRREPPASRGSVLAADSMTGFLSRHACEPRDRGLGDDRTLRKLTKTVALGASHRRSLFAYEAHHLAGGLGKLTGRALQAWDVVELIDRDPAQGVASLEIRNAA